MASLATANLPSSDEEDEDFVPDEVDSEEEGKNKVKKAAKKKRRMRGVTAAEADDSDSEGDGAPAAPVEPEHKRLEKKAKTDDLWSKLNAGGGATRPKAGGANLAALCKPVSAKNKKRSGDESWMRQLGLGASTKPKPAAPSADARSVAAAALASAKAAASMSTAQQHGMVTVTETRRFAGKTITMERQVDVGSKDAAKAGEAGPSDAAAAAKNKSGLDAVLESLAQAKKVTVLDKTKADWRDFRKNNEEVGEELEAHKRSGATYLEKQAFLGRADVAEYERDRDRRLASDVRNRGRL